MEGYEVKTVEEALPEADQEIARGVAKRIGLVA
jgi:hypothetical protein